MQLSQSLVLMTVLAAVSGVILQHEVVSGCPSRQAALRRAHYILSIYPDLHPYYQQHGINNQYQGYNQPGGQFGQQDGNNWQQNGDNKKDEVRPIDEPPNNQPSNGEQPIVPPSDQTPNIPPSEPRPNVPPSDQRPNVSPSEPKPNIPPMDQQPIVPPNNQPKITVS